MNLALVAIALFAATACCAVRMHRTPSRIRAAAWLIVGVVLANAALGATYVGLVPAIEPWLLERGLLSGSRFDSERWRDQSSPRARDRMVRHLLRLHASFSGMAHADVIALLGEPSSETALQANYALDDRLGDFDLFRLGEEALTLVITFDPTGRVSAAEIARGRD
jgi:hypothetical protein